jgi:hypothetical protein
MRTVEDRKPSRRQKPKKKAKEKTKQAKTKKNYRNKSNSDEYQKSLCLQLTRTRGKACSLCTNR